MHYDVVVVFLTNKKKAAFLAAPVISVCHPLTLKCN